MCHTCVRLGRNYRSKTQKQQHFIETCVENAHPCVDPLPSPPHPPPRPAPGVARATMVAPSSLYPLIIRHLRRAKAPAIVSLGCDLGGFQIGIAHDDIVWFSLFDTGRGATVWLPFRQIGSGVRARSALSDMGDVANPTSGMSPFVRSVLIDLNESPACACP